MNLICIVIPCYNEAERLLVNDIIAFLEKVPDSVICFVNDGSNDSTAEILNTIYKQFPDRILIKSLIKNSGKAEAVRIGINLSCEHFSNAEYFGYFDADLATPLESCLNLKESMNTKESLKFSFGSRVLLIGTKIERKFYRHLAGRIIATFISKILGIKVYDTQCGAKLFRKEIAENFFKEAFISKWLFDVEIFARILKHFGKENVEEIMIEVPLKKWIDKDHSKIKLSYFFKIFYDLYLIKRKYYKI